MSTHTTSGVPSARAGAVARGPSIPVGLVARSRELATIDELLGDARAGRAGALGLHGESGVGKSALIDAAVARASELRTVQVGGPSAARTARVGGPSASRTAR
ncbi:MAG: ATP-binding protein, partial [Acidimicrobiales bacterium]